MARQSGRLIRIIINVCCAIYIDNNIIERLAIKTIGIVHGPSSKWYLRYRHISFRLPPWRAAQWRQVRSLPRGHSGQFTRVIREIVLLIVHYQVWINYI